MNDDLIFAWTPPRSTYPPYINVTRVKEGVRILVRSEETVDNEGVGMGSVAVIVLPIEQAQRLGVHLTLGSRAPITDAAIAAKEKP